MKHTRLALCLAMALFGILSASAQIPAPSPAPNRGSGRAPGDARSMGLNNDYGVSGSGRTDGQRDRNGNPIDSTAVNDANSIPIGVKVWKLDKRLGDVIYEPIDTLMLGFQNSNDVGGPTGQYNYLGNLGAPRINRIFMDRKETTQEFFTDPYDFSYYTSADVKYANTFSPYTNLTYYKSINSRLSEENFKSYFAVNANKRLGLGFYLDYLYGRGMYSSQSTAFFNGGLFSSYRGEKYEMHINLRNNNMKVTENGGITDDRYITNPVDMAEGKKQYLSSDIPVRMKQVWNKNTGYHAYLSHRLNAGFYRTHIDSLVVDTIRNDTTVTIKKDTIGFTHEFVPVTSFIHTVEADLSTRRYIGQNLQQAEELYEHVFFNDSTDRNKYNALRNTFGIQLREGFNKYVPANLTAFVTHEMRQFTLPDSTGFEGCKNTAKYKEQSVSIGGVLSKRMGKALHYNVVGEVSVAGDYAGEYRLEGQADLNFPFLGDSARLEAMASLKHTEPVFYMRHFHSKHYWWDQDLEMSTASRMEGKVHIGKLGTTLRAGVENIKNYAYLTCLGQPILNDAGETTGWKDNAAAMQCPDNIQVVTAMVQQRFKLGILHLDGEVAYQKSSNQDVLPVPELSAYGNLYIKTALSHKVLNVELGADVRYFTKYAAPDYSPVIGQFYLQNPENRMDIGGWPMVNAYINMQLKRTRIFVMMYNVNQSMGSRRYFTVPHYPLNPQMVKIGLSWNFYD